MLFRCVRHGAPASLRRRRSDATCLPSAELRVTAPEPLTLHPQLSTINSRPLPFPSRPLPSSGRTTSPCAATAPPSSSSPRAGPRRGEDAASYPPSARRAQPSCTTASSSDALAHAATLEADVIVAAAEAAHRPVLEGFARELCPGATFLVQAGADLGERMLDAFRTVLHAGYPTAVTLGTDVPSLPWPRVAEALSLAPECDLVLGPSLDGGYYLIGMHAVLPRLFEHIAWGTKTVLVDTLTRGERAQAHGDAARSLVRRGYAAGPGDALHPPSARSRWPAGISPARAPGGISSPARRWAEVARLAVIIPTLNEEPSIGAVLDAIPHDLEAEVIVVDNGSTDRTAEIAAAHGARVVFEPHRGYGSGLPRRASPRCATRKWWPFSTPTSVTARPSSASSCSPSSRARPTSSSAPACWARANPARCPCIRGSGTGLRGGSSRISMVSRPPTSGPSSAIRCATLRQLHMQDRGFGWTMEMQAKAARLKVRTREMPVPYRKRVGRSKITGSLRASFLAAVIILSTAARLLRWRP